MKKTAIILFAALVFSAPMAVRAAIEVAPQIIDVKAKAREKLNYTITVKNATDKFVSLYAFVNDINSDEGKQEFKEPQALDKTTSLARWIRIRRGVIDLQPGAEHKAELTIEVNMNAVPGQRHAVIVFAPGSDRYSAEANADSGQAQTLVNLEVEEDIIEKAQLIGFTAEKSVYFEPKVDFTAVIKNIGNREIEPRGYVYLYNRRGEEFDKLVVNADSARVAPDTEKVFACGWSGDRGLGKYRAKLEIEYGQSNLRDLQDTIYFWILPKSWILIVGGGTAFLIVILAVFLFRKTYHHHYLPMPKTDGVIDLKAKK